MVSSSLRHDAASTSGSTLSLLSRPLRRFVSGNAHTQPNVSNAMSSMYPETAADEPVAANSAVMQNGVPPLIRTAASWYAIDAPEYRMRASNISAKYAAAGP